jgi:RNA polymerase-binding transcription factor DksA
MMPTEERVTAAGRDRACWRALLETRWQARLEELTERSLAYHRAEGAILDARGASRTGQQGGASRTGQQRGASRTGQQGGGEVGLREAQALLSLAVSARRKLIDVEEALGRLATGEFGRCEQCGAAIPAGLLALIPEARYCLRCDTGPADR